VRNQIFGLITKYALLLSALHFLIIAFNRIIFELEFSDEAMQTRLVRQGAAPLAFNFILNLITAYVVRLDIKKHQVKTSYVMLTTIVYRPLGVFTFLLFLFLQNSDKEQISEGQLKDLD
jgi:hypothetical protein